MKIGIPVAHFHPGNTAEYVHAALCELGHSADILTPAQFYSSLADPAFDLFFCVDSGEPLNLADARIAQLPLTRVAFWFIDYRHNKDRATRNPPDRETAHVLHQRGGWVFQSQYEDAQECLREGLTRVHWLPLAADPGVWCDIPAAPKVFHAGFVGNVWDARRRQALELILRAPGLRLGFAGHGKAWKEQGAALLRRSLVGFNISSFYGEPFAFDVNMRVFETLSCGVPLFTNHVPSLARIFPAQAPFIRTYDSLDALLPKLKESLEDTTFLKSGPQAREFILQQATYTARMREVLKTATL